MIVIIGYSLATIVASTSGKVKNWGVIIIIIIIIIIVSCDSSMLLLIDVATIRVIVEIAQTTCTNKYNLSKTSYISSSLVILLFSN